MKNTLIKILVIIVLICILGVIVYFALKEDTVSTSNTVSTAEQTNNKERTPNGNSSAEYTGATEITEDSNFDEDTFESTTGGENALLAKSGTSTLNNVTVNKSGDESDENSDFYGTNAAVIATDSATLNINGGEVNTSGKHANAVFSYGNSTINIEDTTIHTTSNNSGGIMVTGGGTINAKNLKVTTEGNSSAAIRSDRGGGTQIVDGGTYTANGVGSPVIYCTADVTVKNATLVATKSEGAVVEGKNSITLENVTLTDTNNSLNGQSSTYKNIFLYQSMSGDADEGTASFTAKNSTITTNKGDTIYVTNTKAHISLTNNKIINNDGDFLRIEAAAWGKSGSNGGDVTLDMEDQEVKGNVIVDSISTLVWNLKNSNYTGTINGENQAKSIKLVLDSNSTLTLTGDCYVTSLEDSDTSYSNINFNGYKLYVNGTAIN